MMNYLKILLFSFQMGHPKFPSEVTQELLEDEEFLKEFFNIVYNVR